MALKLVLTSQADVDALPEAARAFYTERDGKWYLDADGVDHEGKQRGALEKERQKSAQLSRQIAEVMNKLGDVDPEKAREAVTQLRQFQDQAELGEIPEQFRGAIDKIVAKRIERAQADHQTQVAAFQKQLKDASTKEASLTGTLRQHMLHNGIRDLAAKKGVKPEHFDDVVARLTHIGLQGVTWDIDPTKPEGEQLVAKKKNGDIAYGKDASKPMSFEEGFELLATAVPGFFLPNTGGDARPGSGGSRVAGGAYRLPASQSKDVAKYQAAKAEAAKLGVPLVIDDAA
jgi:hypothetical protein